MDHLAEQDAGLLTTRVRQAMPGIGASFEGSGVPSCLPHGCRHFDGKRCALIGCRPSSVCEPAVGWLAGVALAELLVERG